MPVSNFTGRTTTGASVNYEDLLPLKATKVQVMKGAAGAAPTQRRGLGVTGWSGGLGRWADAKKEGAVGSTGKR